jgi:hypothetical protein
VVGGTSVLLRVNADCIRKQASVEAVRRKKVCHQKKEELLIFNFAS